MADYQQQLGKLQIDKLFKFTCVRNPWERLISYYFSPHRGPAIWDRKAFVSLLEEVQPVEKYVSDLDAESSVMDFSSMNYYMEVEDLPMEFEIVCRKMGIPYRPLPYRNASGKDDFKTYYDDELVELVASKYAEEIRYFNFKF